MKIYMLGHARSGKDHAAELLKKEIGLRFKSSSMTAIECYLFKDMSYRFGYKTVQECFDKRFLHRKYLYDKITEINTPDRTTISERIFETNDIYVGLRSVLELNSAKARWDDVISVWIDAEGRIEPESKKSCTITKQDCHFVIENKRTVAHFDLKLRKLARLLKPYHDSEI